MEENLSSAQWALEICFHRGGFPFVILPVILFFDQLDLFSHKFVDLALVILSGGHAILNLG